MPKFLYFILRLVFKCFTLWCWNRTHLLGHCSSGYIGKSNAARNANLFSLIIKAQKENSIIGAFYHFCRRGVSHDIFKTMLELFNILSACLKNNLYNNPAMSGRSNGCSTINKALRFLVTDYICWARTFSRWFIIYLMDGDHKALCY